ncbi:uncharacterized protein LOC134246266 [Saccostrea cucullata]|uniref:uncharacterized protein LOC134246266 n=1 Tax=Saccostrea cuccullata TaxID=36930 RepID=UPI002ED15371
MLPRFRRTRGGDLVYYRKEEAEKGLVNAPNVRPSELPSKVRANALRAVRFHGGDVKNDKHVLGQYVVQFGKYRGQTFLWMVENCLGYSGWLVDAMRRETITQAPLSQNKHAFKDYLLSFDEGREVVELKKEQRVKEEEKKKEVSLPPQVLFANLPAAEARRLQREKAAKSRPTIKPTIPRPSPKKHEMSDEALLGEVEKLEDMLSQGHFFHIFMSYKILSVTLKMRKACNILLLKITVI